MTSKPLKMGGHLVKDVSRCILLLILLLWLVACSTAEVTSIVVEPSVTPPVPGPRLLEPEDGATFTYPQDITLEWEWDRPLGQYEFYDVRVWREGEPAYGITWAQVGELNLDSWLTGQNQAGTYFWQVAVIAGRDGTLEKTVSDPSVVYSFTLEHPLLPTATPTVTPTVTPTPVATLESELLPASSDDYNATLSADLFDTMETAFAEAYAVHQKRYSFTEDTTPDALADLADQVRKDFLDWLGESEHITAVDDLQTEVLESNERYTLSHFRFTNASGRIVEGILSMPVDQARVYPVMLIPNGTGASSYDIFGLTKREYHQNVGRAFAENYIVAAVDIPYSLNDETFLFANAAGVNWEYYRLCDKTSSALDYVLEQPVADKNRVGIYGISLGGWVSATASICDSRIKATAISGTNVMTSFLTHLTRHRRLTYPHQYQYRIADRPDFAEVLYALYPQLVIMELNMQDSTGDPDEAHTNAERVQSYYALRGQPDQARIVWFDGPLYDNGHYMEVDQVKAIFDQYFGVANEEN